MKQPDAVYDEMIKLAAQMADRKGMPSPCLEDWRLPQSTPASVRRMIEDTAIGSDAQCAWWAHELRRIADKLKNQNSDHPQQNSNQP